MVRNLLETGTVFDYKDVDFGELLHRLKKHLDKDVSAADLPLAPEHPETFNPGTLPIERKMPGKVPVDKTKPAILSGEQDIPARDLIYRDQAFEDED